MTGTLSAGVEDASAQLTAAIWDAPSAMATPDEVLFFGLEEQGESGFRLSRRAFRGATLLRADEASPGDLVIDLGVGQLWITRAVP